MDIIKQFASAAIGIAISPLPIVGLIIILLGNKAKKNSFYYSLGWIIGNFIAFSIGLFFMSGVSNHQNNTSLIERIVYGALGILLIFFSIKSFHKSYAKKGEVKSPKWFDKLTTLNAMRALLFSLLLSIANPKNLLLALSAGASTGVIISSKGEDVLAIILFLLIATSSIVIPTLLFMIFGEKLNSILNKLKMWLIINNDVITAVVFLFIGLKMIGKVF